MSITIFIGVITLALTIIIFIKHVMKRRKHPPGPLGFPFLGLIPLQLIQMILPKKISKISRMKFFKQMRDKYGDYWSMETGTQRFVVLASADIIHEAYVDRGQLFSGRPNNDFFNRLGEERGILIIDGRLWRDNRHKAFKALKELGLGKRNLESEISEEANLLIEYLSSKSGTIISNSKAYLKAFINIVGRLNFNEYTNQVDEVFEKFVSDIHYTIQAEVVYDKCNLFPKFFTTKLARYLFADIDRFFTAWDDMLAFIVNKCNKRILEQNENQEPSCVFDYLWQDCDDRDLTDEMKMKNISHSMLDLYIGGVDTTNTFLGFACLMLGRYPELQIDLRREIQNLIDDYKLINMNMKKDCPKLLSFIDEIYRFCTIAPANLHRVMKKCKFRGYDLYPDDIIVGDFGTVYRDETLFENHDIFNPYRFMDKDRTRYIYNKYVTPFGIGKRVCIGESIANMEVFLIISRIILAFDISLPSDTLDSFEDILDGVTGILHGPLKHNIKFTKLYSK